MKPRLTLETFGGDDIVKVAQEAQQIADYLNRACGFEFNGVRCVAVPGGKPSTLVERHQRAQRTRLVVHSDDVSDIEMEPKQ